MGTGQTVTIMTKRKARYKSYLLRLWQESDNGRWRARLQAVEDESIVLHFADIEALICYLLRLEKGGPM